MARIGIKLLKPERKIINVKHTQGSYQGLN
jgi:hypothetical protein